MSPSRGRGEGSARAPFSMRALLGGGGDLSLHRVVRLLGYLIRISGQPLFDPRHFAHHHCSPDPTRGLAEDTSPSVERLLPMPLPPRPRGFEPGAGAQIASSRRRARWGVRRTAWLAAEHLIRYFNYWELKHRPDQVVGNTPNALQMTAFELFVGSLEGTVRRCPSVPMGQGRGSKAVEVLLSQFCARWSADEKYEPHDHRQDVTVSASI